LNGSVPDNRPPNPDFPITSSLFPPPPVLPDTVKDRTASCASPYSVFFCFFLPTCTTGAAGCLVGNGLLFVTFLYLDFYVPLILCLRDCFFATKLLIDGCFYLAVAYGPQLNLTTATLPFSSFPSLPFLFSSPLPVFLQWSDKEMAFRIPRSTQFELSSRWLGVLGTRLCGPLYFSSFPIPPLFPFFFLDFTDLYITESVLRSDQAFLSPRVMACFQNHCPAHAKTFTRIPPLPPLPSLLLN